MNMPDQPTRGGFGFLQREENTRPINLLAGGSLESLYPFLRAMPFGK